MGGYKKIVKIVRGAMIIYIIYLVFPEELQTIVKSVFMIVQGAVVWLWDMAKDNMTESFSNWWDGCKDSVITWVKSQLRFGGGK